MKNVPNAGRSESDTDSESLTGDKVSPSNKRPSPGMEKPEAAPPAKKSVAQMMRDKKKQTGLTLQWYVHLPIHNSSQ